MMYKVMLAASSPVQQQSHAVTFVTALSEFFKLYLHLMARCDRDSVDIGRSLGCGGFPKCSK